ncbi:MAG: sulfatase-like hydrolase/transferase [Planctomycetes bacterium]|nr:sulfatase-like hydrolase/transferase [Planctomycetota bacterium]
MFRQALRALAVLTVCACAIAQDAESRPPNIVVLFADDAGWADFGFQPFPDAALAHRTPQIDRIARDGVRFTSAYMSGCVCSPSRAGLMTGRYQQRFGHETNLPPGYMDGGMSLDERTVADRLHPLGLATGLVGKWHLGYPADYHPQKRGFDWFLGLLQGSRSYWPIENPSPHRVLQENGAPLPEVGYVTDRLGDAAIRFVTEHRDRPFFLFVSFTAPHGPLEAKPDDLAELEDVQPLRRRRYAGLVVALDRAVGRILDALDQQGLADDTLVVFTNDNGGQTQTGAVNLPLRGRKGQLWEGGIRVPMAARWPGRIAPGTTIDDPVISLDLLPTFVAAAGAQPSPDWQLDGLDLLPRLTGAVATLPERPLFWRSLGPNGPIAMRQGRHKLVVERELVGGGDSGARRLASTPHLFDLEADLGETDDRAGRDPDTVAALSALLAAWEAQLGEPRWGIRDDER